MKTARYCKFLIVILAVFGFSFFGCYQELDIDHGKAENNYEYTRRDDLVRLKAQNNNKISIEELQQMAISVFTQTVNDKSMVLGSRIIGEKRVGVNTENRFNRFESSSHNGGNRGRSVMEVVDETDPIEIYEFVIKKESYNNEWYVIASNDLRIGQILAITESSLEDGDNDFARFYKECLQNYIEATIAEYNDITVAEVNASLEEIEAELTGLPEGSRGVISGPDVSDPNQWKLYQTTSDLTLRRAPMLKTNWGQGEKGSTVYAYNSYIKYMNNNQDFYAGCGPVAMAQIIAYHNYIKPNADAKKSMPAAFNIPSVGKFSGTYDLGMIRTIPQIKNTSTAEARGQVAALMYNILYEAFRLAKINNHQPQEPTVNGTGTVLADCLSAFKNFGYTVDYDSGGSSTSVTGTTNGGWSISYNTPLSTITNALLNYRPIFVFGNGSGSVHFWVIDGYGTMNYIDEYYRIDSTGQTEIKTITTSNCIMVHCNLGWDGTNYGYTLESYNGWYIYGIFDVCPDGKTLEDKNITAGSKNFTSYIKVAIPRRP